MNEKELLKKLMEDPSYISEIEDPTEEMQLIAIEKDPDLIYEIENATPKVQIRALELCPSFIEDTIIDFWCVETINYIKSLKDLSDEIRIEIAESLAELGDEEVIGEVDGLTFKEIVCNSIEDVLYYFKNEGCGYEYETLFQSQFFKFLTLEDAIAYCEKNNKWDFFNNVFGIIVTKMDFSSNKVIEEIKTFKRSSNKVNEILEETDDLDSVNIDITHDDKYEANYGLLLPYLFYVECYGDSGHDDYCVCRCNDELYLITIVSYE